jgi:acyl carrier protein
MAQDDDEIGQAVAQVWADVLRIDEVGQDQGFFELGGHSLAALRAVFLLRERFAVSLSLHDLMAARDCAEFTETVRAAVRGDAPARPVPTLVGRRGTR